MAPYYGSGFLDTPAPLAPFQAPARSEMLHIRNHEKIRKPEKQTFLNLKSGW